MAADSSASFCSTEATSLYPPTAADYTYRGILRQAVAAICKEAGFDAIESDVLELLTHMVNSYILGIGVTTRQLTEHAGRTIATPNDTALALMQLGANFSDFPDYLAKCCTEGALSITYPKISTNMADPPVHLSPLKIEDMEPFHPDAPDTFPGFPGPHIYRRTEISGQPNLTYEYVREQAALAKRGFEISLKDFILRIRPSVPLFREFEEMVRKEARQILRNRARLRKSRLLALQDELNTQRLNENWKNCVDEEMPDIFDAEDDRRSKEEQKAQLKSYMRDILAEEMFELDETENSLVRRRVPASCQIIKPTLKNRPYLSALVCTDLEDGGTDDTPSVPVRRRKRRAKIFAHRDGEPVVKENPYLRPPTMPF